MHKSFRPVVNAFLTHKARSIGNTSTDGERLYLFGNCIARHTPRGLEVTVDVWDTVTTRDRLNGLPGVRVWHDKGALYLNGKPWSGAWATIANETSEETSK